MNLFDHMGPRDLVFLGFVLGLLWSERRSIDRGRRVGKLEGLVKQLVALSQGKVTLHDEESTKP